MHRALLLVGLVLALLVRGAQAQTGIGATAGQLRAVAGLRRGSESGRFDQPPGASHAGASARDYRWEGLAVGAVVLGVLGALALHGTCEAGEACTGPTIGGFAVGAMVGGVTGGLLGSLIPKGTQ